MCGERERDRERERERKRERERWEIRFTKYLLYSLECQIEILWRWLILDCDKFSKRQIWLYSL